LRLTRNRQAGKDILEGAAPGLVAAFAARVIMISSGLAFGFGRTPCIGPALGRIG